jgi:hypothetical protein
LQRTSELVSRDVVVHAHIAEVSTKAGFHHSEHAFGQGLAGRMPQSMRSLLRAAGRFRRIRSRTGFRSGRGTDLGRARVLRGLPVHDLIRDAIGFAFEGIVRVTHRQFGLRKWDVSSLQLG